MAASSAHPNFPRNFAALGSLADRSKAAAFGASAPAGPSAPPLREHARSGAGADRDRQERERQDREGQDALNQLSEEQREEINEAVRATLPRRAYCM